MKESFGNMVKSKKEKFIESWNTFVSISKREGGETKVALSILKKLLKKGNTTPEEINFLKGQTKDLLRIVTIMGTGTVSMVIPLALEKILNKYDISIIPKEQSKDFLKEDKIKGGKADKLTVLDISKKFKIKKSDIESELEKGFKIELEHTNDKDLANEIALDHLSEFPDYYTRLIKMEKKAESETKKQIKEMIKSELKKI